MATGTLGRIPLVQAFRGPRRIYVRRVAIVGAIITAVLGVSAWSLLGHKVIRAPTTVASIPPVNTLPGGPKGSPYYRQVMREAARRSALRAQRQGMSSVTPFPPSNVVAEPSPVLPKPALPTFRAPTPVRYDPPSPAPTPAGPEVDLARYRAYDAAIGSVLASLGPTLPATHVYVKPPKPPAQAADRGAAIAPVSTTSPGNADPASAGASRNALGSGASAPPAPVLIGAGHGVYARVLVGGNSDQPGPIVVVAELGPVAGDRMIGNFTRMQDRLVVNLRTLSLPDGQQQSIDAIMVAPDSMQTAVATSVNEHYVTRFLLPVAAAFVQGLGQAIQEFELRHPDEPVRWHQLL